MTLRTLWSSAAVCMLVLLARAVSAQPPAQPATAAPPAAYTEAVAFEGKATVHTRQGPKAVSIVMKKLGISGGRRSVPVPLPAKGLAIFQHRAGAVELTIGQTRRAPLEGEWLTVTLPETVIVTTADDSVLIDAIIVAE